MKFSRATRRAATVAVCALGASTVVGLPAVAAGPTAATEHRTAAPATATQVTLQRTYLGEITSPRYLEAPAYSTGTYVFEYAVEGVAFFNTYVNGAELGYVGGSAGVYRTREVRLSAGGHLVQVTGPQGSGRAKLYIVQVS